MSSCFARVRHDVSNLIKRPQRVFLVCMLDPVQFLLILTRLQGLREVGFLLCILATTAFPWNVQCMSKVEKSQNSFNLSFWYYMMRKGNMYDGQFQTNPWTICLRPFEQCALLKEALLSLFGGGNLKEIMGTRIIRKVDPQKENRPNPEIGMRTTNSWYWEYKDTPSNRHVPSGRLTGS